MTCRGATSARACPAATTTTRRTAREGKCLESLRSIMMPALMHSIPLVAAFTQWIGPCLHQRSSQFDHRNHGSSDSKLGAALAATATGNVVQTAKHAGGETSRILTHSRTVMCPGILRSCRQTARPLSAPLRTDCLDDIFTRRARHSSDAELNIRLNELSRNSSALSELDERRELHIASLGPKAVRSTTATGL